MTDTPTTPPNAPADGGILGKIGSFFNNNKGGLLGGGLLGVILMLVTQNPLFAFLGLLGGLAVINIAHDGKASFFGNLFQSSVPPAAPATTPAAATNIAPSVTPPPRITPSPKPPTLQNPPPPPAPLQPQPPAAYQHHDTLAQAVATQNDPVYGYLALKNELKRNFLFQEVSPYHSREVLHIGNMNYSKAWYKFGFGRGPEKRADELAEIITKHYEDPTFRALPPNKAADAIVDDKQVQWLIGKPKAGHLSSELGMFIYSHHAALTDAIAAKVDHERAGKGLPPYAQAEAHGMNISQQQLGNIAPPQSPGQGLPPTNHR